MTRRDRIKLSPRHQSWIYATLALLFATGVLWLVAKQGLGAPGEFGETTSPLAPLSMQVHGAAAMVFLVLLGTLLPGHVRQAWNARRSRVTGGGMLVGVALLVASGYGLYYLGGEETRAVVSALHWVVGLVLPAWLVWHVRASRVPVGRRARRAHHAQPARVAEPATQAQPLAVERPTLH
jgi:cation transport ATPase